MIERSNTGLIFPRGLTRGLAAGLLALAGFLVVGQPLLAQDDRTADEKAIAESIKRYVAAINKGDARAAAACWCENGHWLSPNGETIEGREAIEKAMAESFGNDKRSLELEDLSVRFLGPNIATEEGTAHVSHEGGHSETSTYIAIHVKEDGKWLLNTVRETLVATEVDSTVPQLKALDWMVGRWAEEAEHSKVDTECHWTSNHRFLVRSYTASFPDGTTFEGTQVIGWDPVNRQVRAWVFDSDGGYGQGLCKRDGDSWSFDMHYQMPDGGKGQATNTFTRIDDDTFSFSSTNRVVDGEVLPDENVENITRVVEEDEEK